MQEASAAESLLRCLRDVMNGYTPRAAVLHNAILAVILHLLRGGEFHGGGAEPAAGRRAVPRPPFRAFPRHSDHRHPHQAHDLSAAASPSRSTASDAETAVSSADEEAAALAAERRRRATSWVSAALATDLSAFGLYNLKPALATITSPLAVVVVDQSAKPAAAASSTTTKSSPSPKSRMSPAKGKPRTGAAAAAAPTTPPAPPEWERGGGAEERGELARRLGEESRGWFLGFVERFLDADVAAAAPWDRERAARMLPQLKRVNDWLGEIGKRRRGSAAAPRR
ncbi:hypothetical protein PR202_gb23014 [Eleusine coracana subsp. coracana]|uniref:DUF6857 domain-containing protein n=1 Tax=Eleusine coracana subsp. coracana TaxID=191504 RepID=A0AAV5FIC2_ELECO|nr:hypothetical protein PR202_gb23014 [Eleusine coracana subsp. coracana]